MARSPRLDNVLGRVRQLLASQRAAAVPDSSLLRDFIERRDEAAFATLVHRHGPMVLAVCRRTLRHAPDAEDACQAAFLVLARKAASIRKPDALASWLHGVAYRVALKLRADRARRERGRTPLVDVPEPDRAEATWRELQAIIDQELAQLPESYRAPLVLCYLEGKTQDEAAKELGWTLGTLRGRLGRGRERLRGRLVRRGLTLSVALFSTALTEAAAFGPTSAALEVTIVRSALLAAAGNAPVGLVSAEVVALTEGVIRSMVLNKLWTPAVIFMSVILVGGSGLLTHRAVSHAPGAAAAEAAAPTQLTAPNEPVKPAGPAPPAKAAIDPKVIRELIEKLGDEEFPTRKAAAKRLEAIGVPALDLLRKAAGGAADAEVRQAAQLLIRTIERTLFGEVRCFEGHTGEGITLWACRVAVTPNGSLAVSGGSDALRSWDLRTGKAGIVFGQTKTGYWAVGISGDGKRVIAGRHDGFVSVFELKTGKEVQRLVGHTGPVWGAALSADGNTAVTSGWGQSIRVWDVKTGKELRAFAGMHGGVRCLALSKDGKLVVAAHFTEDNAPATVRLWDVDKGKEIQSFSGHTRAVTSVGFGADSTRVWSSSFDGSLRLWDVKTGKELKRFQGHTDRVEYAAITPDGKRLVSVGNERNPTLRLWDTATGKQLHESEPVGLGFLCVAVLPDRHHCVTTGKDGKVRLWRWKK